MSRMNLNTVDLENAYTSSYTEVLSYNSIPMKSVTFIACIVSVQCKTAQTGLTGLTGALIISAHVSVYWIM